MNPQFKRVGIYLRERYPVVPGLIFFSLMYSNLIHLYCHSLHQPFVFSAAHFIKIVAFGFCYVLGIRLCDEFKDRATDAAVFPDRALARGAVLYSDISFLIKIVIPVLGAIWLFSPAKGLGLILFAYWFLIYKWFYAEKVLSKNLLLALLTHNPVVPLLYLYLLNLYTGRNVITLIETGALVPVLVIWMSALGWEVARKIRIPKDEDSYITYSKMMGYRGASLFLLLIGLVFGSFLLSLLHDTQLWLQATVGITLILFINRVILFILRPSHAPLNLLKSTEFYFFFTQSLLLLCSLWW